MKIALCALLMTAALPAAAQVQDPGTLSNGLVVYYRLDEAAGPTAVNAVGTAALNGTWKSGVSKAVPGIAGMHFGDPACIAVDGTTSGYVEVLDNAALRLTTNFSIALWVQPTEASPNDYQGLLGKGGYNSRNYLILRESDGQGNKILFEVKTSGGASIIESQTTTDVRQGAWTHIVCTYDGVNGKVYLNGVEAASDAKRSATAPASGTEPLTFGHYPGAHSPFRGMLDDVRLYSRVLTFPEIQALANGYGGDVTMNTPTTLKQTDPATSLNVAQGGIVAQQAVEVSATLSSLPPQALAMEVELRPVGTAFTNVPTTASNLVASGSVASFTFVGLAQTTAFHWQVRAVDADGHRSAWISFGTQPDNKAEIDFTTDAPTPPPVAVGWLQVEAATGAPVDAGAIINDTDLLRVLATVSDSKGADVRLEVELVPVDAGFAGLPSASSTLVPSGQTAVVDFGLSRGGYRWQARPVSRWGNAGAWVAGSEVEVRSNGSMGNTRPGCGSSAGVRGGGLALLVLAALLQALKLRGRHVALR